MSVLPPSILLGTLLAASFLTSRGGAGAAPLGAGVVATQPDTCQPDTAGLSRMASVTLGIGPPSDEKPDDDHLFAAQAVRAQFQAPSTVSLPFWAMVYSPRNSRPSVGDAPGSGMASRYEFRVDSTGRLADPRVLAETASPELNASLVAAVHAADSAGTLPVPGKGVLRDDGWIRLRIVNYERRPAHSVPLVLLRVPQVRADQAVQVIEIPRPPYPEAAYAAGERGQVDIQYVVTAEGRADPQSVKPIRPADPQFLRAAFDAVVRGRFRPAAIGGCAVPALVQQRISFRIRGRVPR